MGTKSGLRRCLDAVAGFEEPRADLEQYRTPPDLAAHLVHTADLRGDIEDRLVVDLGCGTGMLTLGVARRGPRAVVGVERDPAALSTARTNATCLDTATPVGWVLGDATRSPLSPEGPTTVVTNPPFGAQAGNEHADRRFLRTAAALADVSYSLHNAGSHAFVEAFAADEGGTVTDAYAAEFDMPRSFDFHQQDRRTLDVELFRIEWG